MGPGDARTHTRMEWMDALRGAAIALVILAHAAVILVRFDFGASPGWLVAFNEIFAPFRMPTLMILSGMLVPASLRKPPAVYVFGKIRGVAWPYVVWMVLWCALFPAYGSLLNLDTWATSYLWYLLYIFTYYMIAPVTRWVPTWIFVITPWVAAAFIDGTFSRRFFFLMGFFFLGKLVADHRRVLERIIASRWVWLALPLTACYGIVFSLTDPPSYLGYHAPLSVLGVIAAIKVAQSVDTRSWTAPVKYVGRHSLIFYVTHFPVITAVSWAGFALGLPVLLTISAGFVAAIGVGVVAVWLSDRTWVRFLFTLPPRRSAAPPSTAHAEATPRPA